MHGFRHVAGGGPQMKVLIRGAVGRPDIDRGQRTLTASAAGADRSQIKIAEYPEIGVAQVNVHCAGRLVRGQAAGPTVTEAVEQACATVSGRLERLRRRLAEEPVGPPDFTGEPWDRREIRRIGGRRGRVTPARRIARYKTYALALQDADAAALTMDLRDYDFHLFLEATTGEPALVHRAGPDGYLLRLPRPRLLRGYDFTAPVTVDETPLPQLSLPRAVRRLDAGAAAFLGFISTATGRGTVVYRRYDGHLGIVTSLW